MKWSSLHPVNLWRRVRNWFAKRVLGIRLQEVNKDYSGKLIHEKSPFGVLEAYRGLRTNLLYTGAAGEHAVIAFTSVSANEGKSLSCANTAISFAMASKRVLIIDCDMRNPSQSKAFGISKGEGLSEFLSGQSQEVCPQETQRPGLYVLPAGKRPPNPTELLGGDRLDMALEQLKADFDIIFLDLPPVGIVSDAAAAARCIDGFLFVVEYGYTSLHGFQNAIESLERVNAKVLGTVLNNVEQKTGLRYGAKRYGKYGKYGKYCKYVYENVVPEEMSEEVSTEAAEPPVETDAPEAPQPPAEG